MAQLNRTPCDNCHRITRCSEYNIIHIGDRCQYTIIYQATLTLAPYRRHTGAVPAPYRRHTGAIPASGFETMTVVSNALCKLLPMSQCMRRAIKH